MKLIDQNINPIKAICLTHNVEQLFVFGSVISKDFDEQSDIDILIQFSSNIDPAQYFNNYMDFKEKMESLLKREIDIVENQAVKNPVFRKILDRDKRLIYERKSA